MIDIVLARREKKRKGGRYTSTVETKSDGSRRVHSEPAGLARALVGTFEPWMGGGSRHLWYKKTALDDDTPRGRSLRHQIADRGAEGFDFAAEGVPQKFAPVLDHMRRVDRAGESDYSHVFDPLRRDEWDRYWKSRRNGKAPGLSGITVEMVRGLPDDLQDDLLRLLNVARRCRFIFTSWRDRCIVPIPKVQGSVKLSDARPISLLDTISKAYWAMIFARITPEFERLDFFANS